MKTGGKLLATCFRDGFSETSVDFQPTTRHYIPEDRTLKLCLYLIELKYSWTGIVTIRTAYLCSTYLLTELRPFWEAANCAATQELPRIIRNPKVHHRVHKSRPLVPILSQIDPVHTIHPISKIYFNIVHSPTYSTSDIQRGNLQLDHCLCAESGYCFTSGLTWYIG
jgi:hypothetical protein